MRLIQRIQIENWSDTYNAKADLPVLISRLVRGSMPMNTYTFFPAGTAAYVGGYDGIVNSETDYRYVPMGTSLWEFGTEKTVNKKANEDYKKRTENPEGHNPAERTLIFLTPRFWKDKDKWRNSKLAEGVWKDVRAYDCRDMEEWLDEAPAVSRWFAAKTNVLPFEGIITVEEFWKEFAHGRAGHFPPSILTGGRENQAQQLFDFLSAEPDIQVVRAASKDEATAFIIACAKQFEESAHTTFISKSLIVDTDSNFRSLQTNNSKLNLIARFEKLNILYPAVENGHHILVPLGPDDTFNQNTITLPGLDRELQVSSLVSMGFSEEDAKRLSIEAGRDITVLRRLLKFPQNRIKWLQEDIREIIPALLIGRWYRHKPGDRKLIELLSGESYDSYENKLSKWAEFAESPILRIGDTWRLTSPLDAWTNIGSSLAESDFNNLKSAIVFAIKEGNPHLPEDNDNPFQITLAQEKPYSSWAREGLLQSLILISIYGKGLSLKGINEPQDWVDEVINSILINAESNLWIALDRELPLIAEASPGYFLHHVSLSLASPENTLLPMLREGEGIVTPIAHHTGMLWALESLAWMPEYLREATIILAKLSRLDPGIKMANKPINSLLEIYKSWHHQTLASFDERLDVLQSVIEVESDVAWTVLYSMLHKGRDTAQPTHRPRWRLFGKPVEVTVTNREYWSAGEQVLDLLLSIVGNKADRISQLLRRSTGLDIEQRRKILEFSNETAENLGSSGSVVWSTLRTILSENRSHPNAEWALPEEELQPYTELYQRYEPKDSMTKVFWLFDDHWPQFAEGSKVWTSGSMDEHGKRISEARVNAIKMVLEAGGFSEVVHLARQVKEPWTIGEALAKLNDANSYLNDLLVLLDGEPGEISLSQTFFRSLSFSQDLAWIDAAYRRSVELGLSIHAINRFFTSLNQTGELWRYIESLDAQIAGAYWKEIRPNMYWVEPSEMDFALDQLERYDRHFTAIEVSSHLQKEKEPSSDRIVRLLTNAVSKPTNESRHFPSYETEHLFGLLDERKDISEDVMIKLEYMYLSLLDGYRVHRQPKYLHAELAKNPEFFIEIIKWAYLPKNRNLVEQERNELSDEQLAARGLQAYKLLNSMTNLPGMDEENRLDDVFLKNWVNDSRALASSVDRTEVTDLFIGKLLAQYPENKTDNWPSEGISEAIEEIGTDDILSGFSTALFNKRGSSVRAAFAGGDIERAHADYFNKLFKKHRLKYPKMAKVFASLAKRYNQDAKEMDDSAARDRLDY